MTGEWDGAVRAVSCRRLDCTDRNPCARCAAADAEANAAEHRAYYQRTGHCYGCGQPGGYCQCSDRHPCGCRGLHEMGSGLDVDPLTVFAIPAADDQGELW